MVAKGSKLGDSHQLWQMNEINKLIWPAAERRRLHRPGGVGSHGQIAMSTPNLEGATVLTAPPTAGAFTNDIVTLALTDLNDMGIDTTGESYAPIDVTLQEGGA